MREKLIELLKEDTCPGLSYEDCAYCKYDGEQDCFYKSQADHLIANGVVISNSETTTKWIPVTERLPNDHKLVLCRWTRGIGASYGFARYQHYNDVWYVSNEGMPKVTHWMPLPSTEGLNEK